MLKNSNLFTGDFIFSGEYIQSIKMSKHQAKAISKSRQKIWLIQDPAKPENRTAIFYTVALGTKEEMPWQTMF